MEEKIIQKVKELINENTFEKVDCDLETKIENLEKRLKKLEQPDFLKFMNKKLKTYNDLCFEVISHWMKKEPYFLGYITLFHHGLYKINNYTFTNYLVKKVDKSYFVMIDDKEVMVTIGSFNTDFNPENYEKFLKAIE